MATTTAVDAAVIGGGVIGLAVARALALCGREVALLEAERALGQHTSSRNSEVIHAGIYYPTGSLKARLCVEGRRALYAYAAAQGVPFRRTGKLIVATSEGEVEALRGYLRQGLANGVEGLEWLDADSLRELEPGVRAVAGLHSAATGIIDSHALMQALRRDAEARGAAIAVASPVVAGQIDDGGFVLDIGGPDPSRLRCARLVNAAGLFAQAVARTLQGLAPASIPPCHYAKGHYFTLRGPSPFQRLVYPIAVPGGLGVHVTLDLSGQARFGPDVEWIDRIDYSFDEARAPAFEAAIRRYWPALPEGALSPGYTGIRPKLGPASSGAHDFLIQGPRAHGISGLVNLYGIESPGLTAALAIAEHVEALLS
jgi:L-2-hydroxyglutarate oxidase LhgO